MILRASVFKDFTLVKTFMKHLLLLAKITFVLGSVLVTNRVLAQEYYGYYQGQKITFGVATNRLVVKLKDEDAVSRRSKEPASLQAMAVRSAQTAALPGVAFLDMQPGKSKADLQQLIKQVKAQADVVSVSPILLNSEKKEIGAFTDEILVALKPSTSTADMLALAKRAGATFARRYEFDDHTFCLSIDKTRGDALALANEFYESGLFEYAQPNFLLFIDPTTNDPLVTRQWALNNTGSNSTPNGNSGADTQASLAWLITGALNGSGIKVAIVDNGVDLSHPDLQSNLLGGYDAMGGGTNGGQTGDNAHGTACAGIAAAVANNNTGVAGVAYNAKILPVRVYIGNSITSVEACAAGIDWAWNHKADIISCSWSLASPQSIVTDAINRALTQGRNFSGTPLGCIVLASTGNENYASIAFPARITGVIAVGATSMCDRRKSPSSCDGENWWGSNYSTGLDIVAPGVKIYTTDVQGATGYNNGSAGDANYVPTFNGTSAATPHVAGVMAMILSQNPGLTQSAARYILESTADKVGGYVYASGVSGQPNGTWNDEMGYGRVNAYRAVIQAQQSCAGPATATGTYSTSSIGSRTPLTASYQFVPGGSQYYIWMDQPFNFTFSTVGPNGTAGPPVTKTGPQSANFYFSGGSVQIKATATSSPCTANLSSVFVVPNSFAMTPNPASSELTVANNAQDSFTTQYALKDADKVRVPSVAFDADLYDMYGRKVKSQKNVQSKVVFQVADLPAGLYTLRVGQGKNRHAEHIQITH